MSGTASPDFVFRLGLQPEEARRLLPLGANSPQHLLAQIRAAPDAFEAYVGRGMATRVRQALRRMLPDDSSTLPVAAPGLLGVPLDASPPSRIPARFDMARRDALFARVQDLRRAHAPPEQIAEAEQALEAFFANPGG